MTSHIIFFLIFLDIMWKMSHMLANVWYRDKLKDSCSNLNIRRCIFKTSSTGDLPNPGIEPSLLHCRQILYQLSYERGPKYQLTV